jgi:phosphoheptose isomerase
MPIDQISRERIKSHLLRSAELKNEVAEKCLDSIMAAASLISNTFRKGGKVLLCGNGGSAADCQHMATEFVGRLTRDFNRPGLPAIALTTDSSFMTAHANDCGFDSIFERQVEALGNTEDIIVCISTSGNSPNVIRAAEKAKDRGMGSIALTGAGGLLIRLADVVISVPSDNSQYIQEAHLSIEHILCDLVERNVFTDGETVQIKHP